MMLVIIMLMGCQYNVKLAVVDLAGVVAHHYITISVHHVHGGTLTLVTTLAALLH